MKTHRVWLIMGLYLIGLLLLAALGYYAGDNFAEKRRIANINNRSNFATDVAFVSLPELNMSVSTNDGSSGRVRLEISLKAEKKNIVRLEGYQSYITDRFVTHLRKKDSDDLKGRNAMPVLRRELLREANVASYPVPVMDVIFDRFLVQ